jgi:hypothetical protein
MSEVGEEGLLDHADSFFTFLYAFFTRPTGIAVFVVAIIVIVFLNMILNTIDAVRNTFMWFYNIRGGNIVLVALALMLLTSGWDGTKGILQAWVDQTGFAWYWEQLMVRIWKASETVILSGGVD